MANSRVQDAVNQMVDQLDKGHLRKLQADSYLCCATCFENDHYSSNDRQRCVEKCTIPMNQAQQLLQNELQSLQDRLQRCAMGCQDKARDQLGTNPSEADVAKQRGFMEKCVDKCADDHIALIPSMTKRMKEALKRS